MPYVKHAKAVEYYNTNHSTFYLRVKSGVIPTIFTPSGKEKLYWIPEQTSCTDKDLYSSYGEVPKKLKIAYARVSSAKQKSELTHQVNFLKKTLGDSYSVIEDVGSGINYNRKGFNTVLDRLFSGQLEEVVVTHKDRLSRIGFDFMESLFKRFGASIRVLDDERFKTTEQKLSESIIELITVYTASYHGRRSHMLEDALLSDSEATKLS